MVVFQTYCDCWAAGVFDNFNKPISFILKLVHLTLVGEQPVVLEFLNVHRNKKQEKGSVIQINTLNQLANVLEPL